MRQLACGLLVVVLVSMPIGAVDGRDFAGRYDVKSPVETDQGIGVAFIVDVQNVSGAALDGVVFGIEGDGPATLATVGPLDFAVSASSRFSVQLTVTPATYTQWLAGGARLIGAWTDNEGNVQKRVVELTRVPVPDEVQQ
jgi:hypothetical protein